LTTNETLSPIFLPAQLKINATVHGSPIRQLLKPPQHLTDAQVTPFQGKPGWTLTHPNVLRTVVYDRKRVNPDPQIQVLRTSTGIFPRTAEEAFEVQSVWLSPAPVKTLAGATPADVRASWQGRFHFVEETLKEDKTVEHHGLRPPQIGALYAALAHWTASEEAATIVMPTGTGKTETMLALCIQQRIQRLLVVVPNDALRDQIGDKFLTLGLLKNFGVVDAEALYPIVCRLKHIPKNLQEADDLFLPCNVVVTTMSILSGCSPTILSRLVDHCSHLFVDEAHHIQAATWERVKLAFAGKRILQFTATPFREDKRHIGGTLIFNYPLQKAQEEEYFKRINFREVWSFDPDEADKLIAQAAIDTLISDLTARADRQAYDHLIMARADSIAVAERLCRLYQQLAPQFAPVVIHSQLHAKEQKRALTQLHDRSSRIVVCVNMFGEGFDFPELKIAALHEIHRSLAVTLQFTGRFTRSKPNLGEATVVANLADVQVRRALSGLYAENADWNLLLRELSTGAVEKHQRFSQFIQNFQTQPKRYALSNLTPKMSTVVYRTGVDPDECWHPEAVAGVLNHLLETPVINQHERVVVAITQTIERIDWGMIQDLTDVKWDLHVVHWHEQHQLLFIHSTAGEGAQLKLAEGISGQVQPVRGEQTFRVLSGIKRLLLTNLGLKDQLGRAKRFSFHVGSDVMNALTDSQVNRNKSKSNLFGHGFRNGERTSAGASQKGKIWAYMVADHLEHWLSWCDEIGGLLLDDSITIENIIKTAVKPEPFIARPNAVPLAMDWSGDVLANSQDTVRFDMNGTTFTLYDVGLTILTQDRTSPIRFSLNAEQEEAHFTVGFDGENVVYECTTGSVEVHVGKRTWSLNDWFQDFPPEIHFTDGYLVSDHMIAQLSAPDQPFPQERIEVWDWTGIHLRRESQGDTRDPSTIQYRVLEELKRDSRPFGVIFDDDDQGEAADIVAFRWDNTTVEVHLYHCKYSKAQEPGQRVADLYEVCGQTQKSVSWRDLKLSKLLQHMKRRDTKRTQKGLSSRFEPGFGNLRMLQLLEQAVETLDVKFYIYIVQPGLSCNEASSSQLELLAATQMYLAETYQIPLTVIGSA
jgi:superfamily II DNA or RNA helicase